MIFERDSPVDGRFLLGHVDDAEAALPDLLEQLVGADAGAGAFGDGSRGIFGSHLDTVGVGRRRAEGGINHRGIVRESEAIFRRARLFARSLTQLALDPHQLLEEQAAPRLGDAG